MPKDPERNFLRAWREHRGFTQARLAEAIGTTGAVISLLEAGERRLSDKWLLRLAPVLGTRPGHLLEFDPADASSDILEIWADIPEESRDQARSVLETFRARSPGSWPVSGRFPPVPARRRPPGTKEG
jgi:transcriptional regulator with XRE-family HTH domain